MCSKQHGKKTTHGQSQKENVKGEQDRAEFSGGSFFLGLYYLDLTI